MTKTATLHPTDLDMAAVDGEMIRVVQCPDCGQMEIWTEEEIRDHGMCRSLGHCPVCEDTPPDDALTP